MKKKRRSIKKEKEGGRENEKRKTVIKGFFDHNEIELITEAIAGARRYVLQQFKPGVCLDPEYNHREPYPDDYLDRLRDRVSGRVESCLIRGEMGVGEKK